MSCCVLSLVSVLLILCLWEWEQIVCLGVSNRNTYGWTFPLQFTGFKERVSCFNFVKATKERPLFYFWSIKCRYEKERNNDWRVFVRTVPWCNDYVHTEMKFAAFKAVSLHYSIFRTSKAHWWAQTFPACISYDPLTRLKVLSAIFH